MALDSREYTAADTIKVKFTLKNSGEYAGTEVAQLYVRDLVGSIARPVKELKGFQRVALNVGESKVVDFSLPVSALAFWNINNEYIVEPGDFQLWVATDSASGEPVGFTVR
ncbi:MAG: fibronectin type III-like domain-contianing protein [Anaerovoracaceae bacterium]